MSRKAFAWRGALAAAAAAMALAVTACGQSTSTGGGGKVQKTGGVQTVTMGLQPLWEYSPWVYAHQIGLDKQMGMNFKFTWLPTVAPEVEAMQRGSLNFVSSCTACNFPFYKTAPGLRDTLITDQYKGFILVGRKGAPTYSGLIAKGDSPAQAKAAIYKYIKGKTFIFPKPVFGALVNGMLKHAGLSPNDVKIIDEASDAQAATAFFKGTGDFFLGALPQETKLLLQPGHNFVNVGGTPVLGPAGLWYSTMTTTQSFLNRYPQLMLKLLAVWYRTMKYLHEKPQQVIPAMAKIVGQKSGGHFSQSTATEDITKLDSFFTWQQAKQTAFDPKSDIYWRKSLDYYAKANGVAGSSGVKTANVEQQQWFAKLLADKHLMAWVNKPMS